MGAAVQQRNPVRESSRDALSENREVNTDASKQNEAKKGKENSPGGGTGNANMIREIIRELFKLLFQALSKAKQKCQNALNSCKNAEDKRSDLLNKLKEIKAKGGRLSSGDRNDLLDKRRALREAHNRLRNDKRDLLESEQELTEKRDNESAKIDAKKSAIEAKQAASGDPAEKAKYQQQLDDLDAQARVVNEAHDERQAELDQGISDIDHQLAQNHQVYNESTNMLNPQAQQQGNQQQDQPVATDETSTDAENAATSESAVDASSEVENSEPTVSNEPASEVSDDASAQTENPPATVPDGPSDGPRANDLDAADIPSNASAPELSAENTTDAQIASQRDAGNSLQQGADAGDNFARNQAKIASDSAQTGKPQAETRAETGNGHNSAAMADETQKAASSLPAAGM